MPAYFNYARQRKQTPGMAAHGQREPGRRISYRHSGMFRRAAGARFISRRGPQALLELTTWAERGYDLAITPDGPRGPRYVVQDGVMSLAQLTGLPIVPVSFYAKWKIRVKSWDRFQIPLPFSFCEMHLGKAVFCPARCLGRRTRKIAPAARSRIARHHARLKP